MRTYAPHPGGPGAMVNSRRAMVKLAGAMVKVRIPALSPGILGNFRFPAGYGPSGENRPFSARIRVFRPVSPGVRLPSRSRREAGSDCRELRSAARTTASSNGQFDRSHGQLALEQWSNRVEQWSNRPEPWSDWREFSSRRKAAPEPPAKYPGQPSRPAPSPVGGRRRMRSRGPGAQGYPGGFCDQKGTPFPHLH